MNDERRRCTVHLIPDCSPLLNGCTRLTEPAVEFVVLRADRFIEYMKRAAAGENPDLIYAEFYANNEHEHVEGDPS